MSEVAFSIYLHGLILAIPYAAARVWATSRQRTESAPEIDAARLVILIVIWPLALLDILFLIRLRLRKRSRSGSDSTR